MKLTCLVTGAGGRLGTALCRELSAQYDVVAAHHQTEPPIASQMRWPVDADADWKASLKKGENVYCVRADLTRREDVRRLVEVALARFGQIDAIVNLAADTNFHGKLLELWHDDEYASAQLQINSVAPIQLISAVHQNCWKDQSGENAERNRSVVNVSCASGLYVFSDTSQAFYGASKAALNILTMYLALELAPYSVRANAICPNRFSDQSGIDRVTGAVKKLLAGDDTGTVRSVKR